MCIKYIIFIFTINEFNIVDSLNGLNYTTIENRKSSKGIDKIKPLEKYFFSDLMSKKYFIDKFEQEFFKDERFK